MNNVFNSIVCFFVGHKVSRKFGDDMLISYDYRIDYKFTKFKMLYSIIEREHCQRCDKIISKRVIKRHLPLGRFLALRAELDF